MQVTHIEEQLITELPTIEAELPTIEVLFEGEVTGVPVQAATIMKRLPPIVIRKRIDLQLAA